MNKLKSLVFFIVAICGVGVILSSGQVRNLFGEMLALLIIFLVVVELVPQLIVGDESRAPQKAE